METKTLINREKELKRYAKIGRILTDRTVSIPSENVILGIKQECEQIFSGRGVVYFSYAKNVAIGKVFAQKACHISTGCLLADDIRTGRRIYLEN